jgi:hypothetical protein
VAATLLVTCHAAHPSALAACGSTAALQDLENTIGSWDMYGKEDKDRYPNLQVRPLPFCLNISSRQQHAQRLHPKQARNSSLQAQQCSPWAVCAGKGSAAWPGTQAQTNVSAPHLICALPPYRHCRASFLSVLPAA